MSSEPHFPPAPRLPVPQHSTLWTEMEVLQRGVALAGHWTSCSSPWSRSCCKPHEHQQNLMLWLVYATGAVAPTSSIGLVEKT